ncbi:MAG: response regulator [Succinivibrionaceae bacterium]|nr:response regulator [Succinivibrionaceae bacterium]
MNHKVVTVGDDAPFVAAACERGLTAEGYPVVASHAEIPDLSARLKGAWAVLLFAGEQSLRPPILNYLSETVARMGLKVVVVGSQADVARARMALPSGSGALVIDSNSTARQIVRACVAALGNESEGVRHQLLLVDDDPTFLRVMRSWLSEEYDVVPVSSGTQALQYLANHRPELVLLDYEMPVLNGPRVLKAMRSESALHDIPVIFLTGVDSREQVTEALSLHPAGYILKNNDKRRVLDTIAAFFAGIPPQP